MLVKFVFLAMKQSPTLVDTPLSIGALLCLTVGFDRVIACPTQNQLAEVTS